LFVANLSGVLTITASGGAGGAGGSTAAVGSIAGGTGGGAGGTKAGDGGVGGSVTGTVTGGGAGAVGRVQVTALLQDDEYFSNSTDGAGEFVDSTPAGNKKSL
jgi:hypothetical protein